jgi:hypothetical protein
VNETNSRLRVYGRANPFLGAAYFVSGGSLRRVFNILVRVYNTLRMYDMLIRVFDAPCSWRMSENDAVLI